VCKDSECTGCVDEVDDDLCGAGSICAEGICRAGDCHTTSECTDQVCTAYTCGPCADPVPAGVVSRFAADGDATDEAGANDGVAQGGLAYTDGPKCSAFDFDGADRAVQVDDPTGLPTGDATRTIALWVKIDAFEHDDEIVAWGADADGQKSAIALKELPDQGGPTVFFWGHAADVVSDTTLDTDTWYHVAFTFDGTTGTLYVDGAVVGATGLTLDTAAGTALRIGAGVAATDDFFAGDVDDVLIFDRALTADEVASLATIL
jgi:hypothetical protein